MPVLNHEMNPGIRVYVEGFDGEGKYIEGKAEIVEKPLSTTQNWIKIRLIADGSIHRIDNDNVFWRSQGN